MALNEEQIIEGSKVKDSRSQALLYKQYAPFLYGMALRYTKSVQDAQDILQEAFVRIFDNIEQYSGKGTIQGWMTRIVINQALKLHKSQSKHPIIDSYDDYQEEIPDHSVIESDKLTHEILLGFIRDLPNGYRIVFNLCEIEGYSYDEVAEMLNCTPSTCRSQLFKAKNALRKRVNDFNEKEKRLFKK